MIVNKTVIKHKIGELEFELFCQPEAPCHVILDALRYFKGTIQDIIDEASAKNEEVNEIKKEVDISSETA